MEDEDEEEGDEEQAPAGMGKMNRMMAEPIEEN